MVLSAQFFDDRTDLDVHNKPPKFDFVSLQAYYTMFSGFVNEPFVVDKVKESLIWPRGA
jgi:hypothetical protein